MIPTNFQQVFFWKSFFGEHITILWDRSHSLRGFFCIKFVYISQYVNNRFSMMPGPSELSFFQLVVLLHRSQRHSNSFWAHRMFEISSHKVNSILSMYKLKFGPFLAKSSKSVLDDTVTQRADIWGFGSIAGYNVTPRSRLLGSLHVIEIFKKDAAENWG